MLLSKKISDTAYQRSSRKILEKLLKELSPERKTDPSFKVSKDATALVIGTTAIIDHFSVADVWQSDTSTQLNKVIERVVHNDKAAFSDPLDQALRSYAAHHQTTSSKHGPMLTLAFDQAHQTSGNIWHYGGAYELAIKGAPEYVLAKCDLTENEKETAERKLHQLASGGSRVVAIAHASLSRKIDSFNELTKKDTLIFDGFALLTPHLSPYAKRVVKAAQGAGISVYLVTGDHSESALHMAKELGIATSKSQVLDSRRMHVMTDEELDDITKKSRVFSRTTPKNKARIVAHFKSDETLHLRI